MSCTPRRSRVASALVIGTLSCPLLVGCGGSSKPSYCSKVSELKTSIDDLGKINIVEGGLGSVKTALQKVQTSANAAVSAAKHDFPNETSTINSSVHALVQSVQSLPSSPSPGSLLTVAQDISSTVTAVKSFSSATSSKCG